MPAQQTELPAHRRGPADAPLPAASLLALPGCPGLAGRHSACWGVLCQAAQTSNCGQAGGPPAEPERGCRLGHAQSAAAGSAQGEALMGRGWARRLGLVALLASQAACQQVRPGWPGAVGGRRRHGGSWAGTGSGAAGGQPSAAARLAGAWRGAVCRAAPHAAQRRWHVGGAAGTGWRAPARRRDRAQPSSAASQDAGSETDFARSGRSPITLYIRDSSHSHSHSRQQQPWRGGSTQLASQAARPCRKLYPAQACPAGARQGRLPAPHPQHRGGVACAQAPTTFPATGGSSSGSYRLLIQRPDSTGVFSGDFNSNATSNGSVASLQPSFTGQYTNLEVLNVNATNSSSGNETLTPAQLCAYLKAQNPGARQAACGSILQLVRAGPRTGAWAAPQQLQPASAGHGVRRC